MSSKSLSATHILALLIGELTKASPDAVQSPNASIRLSSSGQSLVRICPVSNLTAEWLCGLCARLQRASTPTSAIWAAQPYSISTGEMGMRALALTALLQHCHRACSAHRQLSVPGLWIYSTGLIWPSSVKKSFRKQYHHVENTVTWQWNQWLTLNFKSWKCILLSRHRHGVHFKALGCSQSFKEKVEKRRILLSQMY